MDQKLKLNKKEVGLCQILSEKDRRMDIEEVIQQDIDKGGSIVVSLQKVVSMSNNMNEVVFYAYSLGGFVEKVKQKTDQLSQLMSALSTKE